MTWRLSRNRKCAWVNIESEAFRPQIERLLRWLGLASCPLLIAESIQAWATARGYEEPNPFRAAMVLLPDGPIVLLSRITPDIQAAIRTRIELGGFDVAPLQEPVAFLEHLVLHEAARLVLPRHPDEATCEK